MPDQAPKTVPPGAHVFSRKIHARLDGMQTLIEGTLAAVSAHTLRLEAVEAHRDLTPLEANVEGVTAMIQGLREESERRWQSVEKQIRDVTLATAEGIERVDRAERRIRTAVSRAQAKLRESGVIDETIEAEAGDLRLIDEPGGAIEGVPGMPSGVGPDPTETSSIRGVPAETLRRVRGM